MDKLFIIQSSPFRSVNRAEGFSVMGIGWMEMQCVIEQGMSWHGSQNEHYTR